MSQCRASWQNLPPQSAAPQGSGTGGAGSWAVGHFTAPRYCLLFLGLALSLLLFPPLTSLQVGAYSKHIYFCFGIRQTINMSLN